ncbi:hypothetical protein [Brumimicrobium oceani]|uniref:Peptidase S74 domain-containing protein n=1 Tax=Brumimicrobium oceani TaxID=2100725 RepID=A0A2U2XCS8_9FLAO|nr:hypothetical protein [Brumimicrobium oceani]PWH85609.1 hypothetical protein DIT68_08200 [Brumimicrobium oceani]
MKKLISILAIASISVAVNAQYNTSWPLTTSNSIQAGYVGVGTSPTANSNTVLPNFNFQVHGVVDYIGPGLGPGFPSSMSGSLGNDKEISTQNYLKSTINYGKAARIGLTNSITGMTSNDGGLVMMANNNLFFQNLESGNLTLSVPSVGMTFKNSTSRISVGGIEDGTINYAKFSIISTNDNGLSVNTNGSTGMALRLRVTTNSSSLIEGYGVDNTKANFQVTGSGEVYARKYITTLAPFPDYVFQPDYELRTFSELRTFINTNKHLPNMPTAVEVEENGADIGEINRLLVEKVEELTLYILELEERVVEVESSNEEESEMKERITRLEKLILELSK